MAVNHHRKASVLVDVPGNVPVGPVGSAYLAHCQDAACVSDPPAPGAAASEPKQNRNGRSRPLKLPNPTGSLP